MPVVARSDLSVHSHVARGEVILEIVRSGWVVGFPQESSDVGEED